MAILLIFLAITGILTAATYNRLVRRRLLVREAYSGIDVQLKRRCELVPRLVEVTKGYLRYEQKLLENIVLLRSQALQAPDAGSRAPLEAHLSQGLRQLVALAEAYPDLKANASFQELAAALVRVEDDLQSARRYYNGAVRDYTIGIESFPGVLLAGMLGFGKEAFFELEAAAERPAPGVDVRT